MKINILRYILVLVPEVPRGRPPKVQRACGLKELIQMDINKMMTNEIFTANDKNTQSEHELDTIQNHAITD